jgi:hypothetical protein
MPVPGSAEGDPMPLAQRQFVNRVFVRERFDEL